MKCTVVRDGKERELEARDLVPGDIIILEEGESIAADAKVGGMSAKSVLSDRNRRFLVTTRTKTASR